MFGREEIFYVIVFLALAFLMRWLYLKGEGDEDKKK